MINPLLSVWLAIFVFVSSTMGQEVPHLQSNVVLKLEPNRSNPRNSEGSFLTLKNGNILFVYTHYTAGQGGDHDPAHLASRISKDGGRTWSDQDERVLDNEGEMNVMSVSLLQLDNEEIAMFYLRKNTTDDCLPYVRFSRDEGKSWSPAVPCITDKSGYFVLNNDRVIQLENGRLLMAVAWHKNLNTDRSGNGNLFSYYSDDHGRTWKASDEVSAPRDVLTQEPGLVELKNGQIMMFIRATNGRQMVSYSGDKGVTWSSAVPYVLNSPLSPASIERIPTTGDLLAVWNNSTTDALKASDARTPLTVAISKDDGQSWQNLKNIEIDPDGWYCYTALHFDGGNVLLAYCAGSQKAGTHLAVTDLAMLSLTDIYK